MLAPTPSPKESYSFAIVRYALANVSFRNQEAVRFRPGSDDYTIGGGYNCKHIYNDIQRKAYW